MRKSLLSIFALILCLTNIFAQKDSEFVTTDGTKFKLNGKDFYFQGSNVYDIGFNQPGPKNFYEEDIISLFKFYKKNNITVLRAWAFSNLEPIRDEKTGGIKYNQSWWKKFHFQKEYGKGVDYDGMKQLCYVIQQAEKYDIKLILSLTNFEHAFGGIPWYMHEYLKAEKNINMSWKEIENSKEEGTRIVDFFSLKKTRNAYKTYVNSLLNYKNPLTDRLIKDEPAIMAWDLCNEPHTKDFDEPLDKRGDTVYEWVKEMSGYIKNIDKKHLVTTGEEGYIVGEETGNATFDWLYNGIKGVDFKRNATVANVDFLTIHSYLDRWDNFDVSSAINFCDKYFKDRADIAKEVNKPIVLEEYGYSAKMDKRGSWKKDHPKDPTNAFFRRVHGVVNKYDYAGMLVWQLMPGKHSENNYNDESENYDILYDIEGADGWVAIKENATALAKKSNGDVVIINATKIISISSNSVSGLIGETYTIKGVYGAKGDYSIALKDIDEDWQSHAYSEVKGVNSGENFSIELTIDKEITNDDAELIWEVQMIGNSTQRAGEKVKFEKKSPIEVTPKAITKIKIIDAPTTIARNKGEKYKITASADSKGSAIIYLKNTKSWKEDYIVPKLIELSRENQDYEVLVNNDIEATDLNLVWQIKLVSTESNVSAERPVSLENISKIVNISKIEIIDAPTTIARNKGEKYKITASADSKGSAIIYLKNTKSWKEDYIVPKLIELSRENQDYEVLVNNDIDATDLNLVWQIKLVSTESNVSAERPVSLEDISKIEIIDAPTTIARNKGEKYKIIASADSKGSAIIYLKNTKSWKEDYIVPKLIELSRENQDYEVLVNNDIDATDLNLVWQIKLVSTESNISAERPVSLENISEIVNISKIEIIDAPTTIARNKGEKYKITASADSEGSAIIYLKNTKSWKEDYIVPKLIELSRENQDYEVLVNNDIDATDLNLVWQIKLVSTESIISAEKPVSLENKTTSIFSTIPQSIFGPEVSTEMKIIDYEESISRRGQRFYDIKVYYPQSTSVEVALKDKNTWNLFSFYKKGINVNGKSEVIHKVFIPTYIKGQNLNLVWEVKNKDGKTIYKDVVLRSFKSIDVKKGRSLVFPVPTNNFVNVKVNQQVDRLELVDVNGRIKISRKLNVNSDLLELDITQLSSGSLYFLNLIKDDIKVSTHKVIKN